MTTRNWANSGEFAAERDEASATQHAREFLQEAALLGPAFTVRELCLVTGLGVTQLLPMVRDAIADGVLCERDRQRLGFCDAAVRATLRAGVPAAVGSELHRDLAQRLQAEGAAVTVVAEHLLESTLTVRDLPWVEAVAHGVAPQQTGTAVALWDRLVSGIDLRDPRWFLAQAGHAEALLAAGRPVEAERTAQAALARGAGSSTMGRLRRVVSTALLWQGRWRPARAHAVTVAGALELFPTERAEQLTIAAAAAMLEGRSAVAVHLCERAERAAEVAGATWTDRQVLAVRGHIAHRKGDLGEAERALTAAAGPSSSGQRRPGVAEVWSRLALALVLADTDRFNEADTEVSGALAEARTWGWVPGVVLALLVRVRLYQDRGALSRASACLEDEQHALADAPPALRPLLELEKAWVELWRDGPAGSGAGPWEPWLPGEFSAVANLLGLGRMVSARAKAHRLSGDEAAAVRELTEGWAACAKAGLAADLVRLGPEVADAARRSGDAALATEVSETVAGLAAGNPGVAGYAAAAVSADALATADPERLMTAMAEWRDSPRRLHASAVTELLAVALLQAPGHREAGQAGLERAADGFAAAGAMHDAGRLRALTGDPARTGRRPRATRPAADEWDSLTRTERVVAGYVEQGATNAEIARRMVLSRRTVETHVSHILAKLGLRSRADLILAAAQRDRRNATPGSRTADTHR